MLGKGFRNRVKTHCPHGHLYSGENLYVMKGKHGLIRKCRTCRKLTKQNYITSGKAKLARRAYRARIVGELGFFPWARKMTLPSARWARSKFS